jgi:cytochrome c5
MAGCLRQRKPFGTWFASPGCVDFNHLGRIAMRFPIARITFLGFLGVGAAAAQSPAFAADGKAVYDKTCVVCHASGVANAPKLGDKAAWAPRVATGKDALFASVIKGKGAMPPKAGAADLKDDDIKAAIEFMLASVK